MKDASTKDILENIRKQLEAANNNLKQAADNGELEEEGDSVNLNSEEENHKIEQDEEEPTDEVRIEEKTPAKEKEEVLLGLAAVKQNLQSGINNEAAKPVAAGHEEVKHEDTGHEQAKEEESLEPDEDEDWEFLEEEEEEENDAPEAKKIDVVVPENTVVENEKSLEAKPEELHNEDASSIHNEEGEVEDENLEEDEDFEDDDLEEEEHSDLEDEEASDLEDEDIEADQDLTEEEDLAKEEELENKQTLEHSQAKPYTYYEKEEVQKIPDYTNHEIIPEGQIANEIADKISASLSNKFAKMLDDAKVLKSSDAINDLKVKDLVLEALPPILEKWIDKNQNLILNVVEKVAEKNISAALSKIKF